tara:strand:+ start:884 stop:1294 length:411 start_codon:yes stop_codon:yes gene_type:complete
MIHSEILLLIALIILSIFGLQGAMKLSINHLIQYKFKNTRSCNKILLTKEAFFINIPIAYLAIIFYSILILQLIQLVNLEGKPFFWIYLEIILAFIATIYYAYIMILKLKIICIDCIRIYLANLLMGTSIIAYHFI